MQGVIVPGDRVLHFAPEPIIARNIARIPGVVYVAADIDPNNLWLAAEVPITQADITDQPWQDESFDVVFVSHVLEHVPDDAKAMRELRRVVTDGGVVVSQHPRDPVRETTYEDASITSPEDRLRLFGQRDHVRVYGADLTDRWIQAGFEVRTLYAYAGPGNEILEAKRC